MAPPFDGLRAVVEPGAGVVMRFPGLVCLTTATDPAVLAQLVSICREVTATASDAPARPLARRLAGWLATTDDAPDLGTLAEAGPQLGVFLHGAVAAVLGEQRICGGDAAAWTDRLVTAPDGPLALVTGGGAPVPGDADAGVLDLRAGVVSGGGVVLVAAGRSAPSGQLPVAAQGPAPRSKAPGPAPAPRADPAPVDPAPADAAPVDAPFADGASAEVPVEAPPPVDAPAEEPVVDPVPLPDEVPGAAIPGAGQPPPLHTPKRAAPIFGVAPEEPARAPLDGGPGTPASPAAAGATSVIHLPPAEQADDRPRTRGFLCSRNHLNDPRNQFCVICGIRMAERTGVAVLGLRPPLGLLVFDDGATFTVDADYLLGRMPESDPRVRSGELRPLSVQDPDSQVSRGHLVIKLSGWDVTAIDESRNGTLVAGPTEGSWSRLPSRQPLRLVPGTRIRVGGRSFIFESPSGVR